MVSFPRFTRPHTVILKHRYDEDEEYNGVYETVTLKYVKFDENYGLVQSQKGLERSDDALCIIDMNDLYAIKENIRCWYISANRYTSKRGYFSIAKDDIIIFDCREYTVTSINEINPFGREPLFIEVRCNG